MSEQDSTNQSHVFSETVLDSSLSQALHFDENGLLPAVIQDHLTGQVRMLGYMNQQSLLETLQSKEVTFYSRSKKRLWKKGESSGNVLQVRSLFVDCDHDTILILVEPKGPTCHTGTPSCFFRKMTDTGLVDQTVDATAFLDSLERELVQRKSGQATKSYTKSLLDGGAEKIGAKLREEADELARALAKETDERVLSEAADVMYHLMVGLVWRNLTLRGVMNVLLGRTGQSGHDEKRARPSKP